MATEYKHFDISDAKVFLEEIKKLIPSIANLLTEDKAKEEFADKESLEAITNSLNKLTEKVTSLEGDTVKWVNNDDYLFAFVDNEDSLVMGIRKDGSLHLPCVSVKEYQSPVITEFVYPTLGFREGSAGVPTLKFTQDWTDNNGNSGTLTEETTPFTAEYVAYNPGGEGSAGFSLGEDGRVTADGKNVSGETSSLGSVMVAITANGLIRAASTNIDQKSRTAGIVDPEVKIDSTIFQEHYESTTVKLSFNIGATMNSASSVTPKYFLDTAGNKYDVVEEEIVHDNSSSSGATTTKYWAELPYGTDFNNYVFHLWCEFTFATGETSRGYEYTDTDDVQSTNYLILDTSNNFRVWG